MLQATEGICSMYLDYWRFQIIFKFGIYEHLDQNSNVLCGVQKFRSNKFLNGSLDR